MALPLESVKVGDWLLCTRGNKVQRHTQMGEPVTVINHEPEGVIMQVLAISVPFVFVKVYPIPCEDPTHPIHPTFNVTWNWKDVEFTRPSRSYLRTYLRLIRKSRRKYQVEQIKPRPKPLSVRDIFRTEDPEDPRNDGPEPPEPQRIA